jgi:hypothetical protein
LYPLDIAEEQGAFAKTGWGVQLETVLAFRSFSFFLRFSSKVCKV